MTRQVKDGTYKQEGWPQSAYGVSKVGVTAMTPIQQAEMDKVRPGDDIIFNCVSMKSLPNINGRYSNLRQIIHISFNSLKKKSFQCR